MSAIEKPANVRGDYGSCAAIPMADEEREQCDAMAVEMCANSACDVKALLLARRILDLLKVTS
jgi:hypothetical protein